MKPTMLTCNTFARPNNIEELSPGFGWQLPQGGQAQTAYQLVVEKAAREDFALVWDTGKVLGGDTQNISCDGLQLEGNSRYQWKVRFWDESGEASQWSEAASFETGLGQSGWKARWIGYDEQVGEAYDPGKPFYCADDFAEGENEYYLPPLPYLRYTFTARTRPVAARLYISAFGLVQAFINGGQVGREWFTPGLSDYSKTVYSRAFDVTDLLWQGENALGVILADGWYAGYIGLNAREWYGSKPRVMAQLELEYADGSTQTVVTDEHWRASYGALREGDIFEGECYDATMELAGWSEPGYNDTAWAPPELGAEHDLLPTAHPGVPVVEHGRLPVKARRQIDEDTVQLDFGANVSGVVALRVRGPKGARLVLRHAEILDETGRLYLAGNRSARSQDTYVLSGRGEEECCPRFTYHGFRYAEITGVKTAELLQAEVVMIGSALPRPGSFACASPVVNNVFEIARNTQRSNMMEVPTDCCARDERLGWGAEGNHFAYAMTYLNDNRAFIRKWAMDIWDGQMEDGGLQAIAPPMRMKDVEQFVGDLQSNHGIYMLHALYRMYGDTSLVRVYFDKLEKYFAFLKQNSDRHVRIATSGDWLGIWETTDQSDVNHGYGDCSPAIIGTAHYALVADMMTELCGAVQKPQQEQKYRALAADIRAVFRKHFIQRDGSLRCPKQGELVMALFAGFFTEAEAANAAAQLRQMLDVGDRIFWRGGTLTTPYLLHTLRAHGMDDIANRFLAQTAYPSLGYMAEKGATAIWERWDAIHEDGVLHPQMMNAHNHIGFSVLAADMISGLVGIDTVGVGFRKIRIRPGVGGGIAWAKGSYESLYGKVECAWEQREDGFTMRCVIPPGTSAELHIPAREGKPVFAKREGNREIAQVPPGEYEITYSI